MIDLINDKQKVFIVGIKGVAMTNLALIMKQMGHEVKGSDVEEEFITDEVLVANDIEISNTFENTAILKGSTLLIYAAGHGGKTNPQVQYAMNSGITVLHQIELLGEILKLFPNSIAVSGCHGKTTTSSLIAYALEKVGSDPSYMIGVPNFNEFSGGKYGASDYMVVEADEYGISPPDDLTPKFLKLLPKYLLITNIDFDHPDVFQSIEATKDAFVKLIKIVLAGSTESKIIVCIDDENLETILQMLPRNRFVTYGRKKGADFRMISVDSNELKTKYSFEFYPPSEKSKKTVNSILEIFGEKNVSNAIGAIATLATLGFDPQKIADSMTGFKGAMRRFELKNHIQERDIFLFDDYAHHPTEIEATINATRLRFNDRRLFVIFQPHTFSRTRAFKNEFVDALSLADFAIILPVFQSAREKSDDGEGGNTLELAKIAKVKNKSNVQIVNDKHEVLAFLTKQIKKGDIIFTMGAGDVYKLDADIIQVLDN